MDSTDLADAEAGSPAAAPADPTPERILAAARSEFAARGLEGARIAAIADAAGCNKAMIYHYFDSKDGLFAEVLARNYQAIRAAEAALDLDEADPAEAMRRLVGFSADYIAATPEFVWLLSEENLHEGRHLADRMRARRLNSPLVMTIARLLDAGVARGVFRRGIDPVQLYISIASLCCFPVTNRHTLAAIFDLPPHPEWLASRRDHVIGMVMAWLAPAPQPKDRA